MTTALVVGAGAVGSHAARQLEATPGIDRILLADPDSRRLRLAAERMAIVEPVDWLGDGLPDGVEVVAAAVPAGADRSVAEVSVEAGVPFASCADGFDAVQALFDLSPAAASAGITLVAGAGLAPGLSEVLAMHVHGALDEVDEVDVARFGVSGPACRVVAARAARGRAAEYEAGAFVHPRAGSHRRLVYFPPPVGPRDCGRVESAVPLVARRVLPGVRRITVRHAALPLTRRLGGWAARASRAPAALGAAHVEVRGSKGRAREVVALGVVDHLASVTGAVLATAAAALVGLGALPAPPPGTRGFAELGPSRALLMELAARGVRAARFDGRS